MRESDWNFVLHWVPSLGIACILAVFALVLQALERRSKREQRSGTARK